MIESIFHSFIKEKENFLIAEKSMVSASVDLIHDALRDISDRTIIFDNNNSEEEIWINVANTPSRIEKVYLKDGEVNTVIKVNDKEEHVAIHDLNSLEILNTALLIKDKMCEDNFSLESHW